MNAEIFNECEKQFIKAIKSSEKYLEDFLTVNIKPREEGSLIDTIEVVTKNPAFCIILGSLIGFLFSRFAPAVSQSQKTANIIDNISKIRESIKAGNLTEEEANKIIENDKDLKKFKSNFFKNAKKEQQLTKIETTTKKEDSQKIVLVVVRKDFDSLILPETTEKIEGLQQAKIYIVAPILVKGRKDSWKGIFEDNSIDFKIKDEDFLEQVWNQSIKFSNGTFINCELKIVTTINVETEEIKISREVIKVINYSYDDKQIVKITHKKKPRKEDSNQLLLFDNVSSE